MDEGDNKPLLLTKVTGKPRYPLLRGVIKLPLLGRFGQT